MDLYLAEYHPTSPRRTSTAQTAAFFDLVKGAKATVRTHRYLPFPEHQFAAMRKHHLLSAGIDLRFVESEGLTQMIDSVELIEPFTGRMLPRVARPMVEVYEHTDGKNGEQIISGGFGVAVVQHPEIALGDRFAQYPYLAFVQAMAWNTLNPRAPYRITLCRASEWIAERIASAASKARRDLDRSQQDWARQHEELFAAKLEEILRMPRARSS